MADFQESLIKKAKTDADRVITYDPEKRPEVSNLLMLISLATGRSPEAIAEEIGFPVLLRPSFVLGDLSTHTYYMSRLILPHLNITQVLCDRQSFI